MNKTSDRKSWAKRHLPPRIRRLLGRILKGIPSKGRRESNRWLRKHTADIHGRVLSIGSGSDEDGEGKTYRSYFKNCSSYTTSDISPAFGCDMVLDTRCMPEIADESFDCIFCSAVLEHVDDCSRALKEITRILKSGGVLFLGLPFRQPIHMAPFDYWRFTEHGIRFLLQQDYEIEELVSHDNSVKNFPAAYWVRAKKRCRTGDSGALYIRGGQKARSEE